MTFRRMLVSVGHHAHLPTNESVLDALRAFFNTLSERVQSRDALLLASDLPPEIASFLLSPPRAHGEIFADDEFFNRMAEREGVAPDIARQHARVIGAVVAAYISDRGKKHLGDMLPASLRGLLEPLDRSVH